MVSGGPLLFFDFVTHYGGSARVTAQLIRHLRRWTEVTVLDAYGACPAYLGDLAAQGTPAEVLVPDAASATIGGRGLGRAFRLVRSAAGMARLVRRLRQAIGRIGPRAIWVNSQKALFALDRAIGGDVPTVYHVHGELGAIKRFTRPAWRRLAAAVGVSEAAVRRLREMDLLRRIEVIHNGVDVGEVLARAEGEPGDLPGADAPLRLVMPASLIPLKNHGMAVRGLADFVRGGGQATLWICGDIPNAATNPYAAELLEMPKRLGVGDHVHFLSWRENVPAVLARGNVMTLTSNTEGLPMSVLEAMALGRCVLATSVGGIPEVVRDGVDGVLVAPRDAGAFTEALKRLSDPAVRERMGQAARHRVEQDFTLARQAGRFAVLLDEIAGA